MLVYYCYRQKRDNPNDAFWQKNEDIKMPMVCDKQLSVIYWKTISEQCGISFYQNEVGECVRLF
jgi:hypothetical protein